MENATISRLSDLEPQYVEQTAALLVDSFYYMLKGISKERERLRRLFMPCMQLDLFHVLLQNNQVAGMIAVSDFKNRAIMIREDVCISMFGPLKGKLLTRQLRKILSVAAISGQEKGYIDFLATAPEFKRCGVATRLLDYVEQNTDFKWLYLDVLTSNRSAICLYEKSGYVLDSVKKNIWMRLAGIKEMKIMKKEL